MFRHIYQPSTGTGKKYVKPPLNNIVKTLLPLTADIPLQPAVFIVVYGAVRGALAKLRKTNGGFAMSVCLSAWNNSTPTGWLFMNKHLRIFLKSVDKIQFRLKSDKKNDNVTWGPKYIYDNISLSVLLRKRKVSNKSCRENQNTDFGFSNFFSGKSYRLCENSEKWCRVRQATDDDIVRRMRIACWIIKATDTHSEYVILLLFSAATRVRRKLLHVTFPVLFVPRYVFRRQDDLVMVM